MGKRVFISSVTEGLRQERIALPGLIRALDMDPVRFEDFTALPEPSREVCLQAVESSDVYLLLIGEHYGTPFPDTGLSPTHEEHRAAINKGLPRLAFRRRGVTMEQAQAAFTSEVEAYETGPFRGSWEEIGEFLSAVSSALAQVDTLVRRLSFTQIGAPVNVEWLTAPDRRDQVRRIRGVDGRGVPDALGDDGGAGPVATGRPDCPQAPARHRWSRPARGHRCGGQARRWGRRPRRKGPTTRSFNQEVIGGTVDGASVTRTGEVCAWTSLPRDMFGAVVNAASLSELATPLVILADRILGEMSGDTSMTVVPSIAITGAGTISIGDPGVVRTRSSAQIPMRSPRVVTLPGDETANLSAIVSGARDVGLELGTRAEQALHVR